MAPIVRTLLVVCAFYGLALPLAADPQRLDVRLVVDVSGSMKQNDPHNLRRPAVRLITELLPDGSRAGVWTFGEYVNMLVPHGTVDQQWREHALARSSEINSVALRTHIGRALEVASDDFYRDQTRKDTHFILLTDGVVDVVPASHSDADARNRAERDRILTQVIPRLAEKGAHIHAIALSQNADSALLKQMALATDGSYSIAETDESLSRVFLDALERSAPSEEVPLRDNRFTIDHSISEFTAVIFHGPDKSALGIKTPSSEEYLKQDFDNRDSHSFDRGDSGGQPALEGAPAVRWISGADYTLVTVVNPAGGRWELLGELGEGSRVKVISDLKMAVSNLPGYFFAGDQLPLNIMFEADGEVITDPEFLQFLSVDVQLRTEDGRTGARALSDPNKVPEDGVYRDLISRLSRPGEYTFTVVADGKTFQRQRRQTVVLRPPMEVAMEGHGVEVDSYYDIQATVVQPDLKPDETRVVARITGPDSGKEIRDLTLDPSQEAWSLQLTDEQGAGEYTVVVELRAKSIAGEEVEFASAPVTLQLPRQNAVADYPMPVAQPPAEAQPDPVLDQPIDNAASEAAIEPDVEDAAQAQATAVPVEQQVGAPADESAPAVVEDADEDGFLVWIWTIAGGGVLVVVLGIGGWLLYRKRQRSVAETEDAIPAVAPGIQSEQVQDEEEPLPIFPQEEEVQPEEDEQPTEPDEGEALVESVMAEIGNAEDTPEAEPLADDDEASFDDEDEFSLEDFDLSDADELPSDVDDSPDTGDPDKR